MRPSTLFMLPMLVAGCLASSNHVPNSSAPAPHVDMGKLADALPCDAPMDLIKTTSNLRRLSLTTFEGAGGPQELDARGDLLLAARAGGFDAVNISDPTSPKVLDHYGEAGGMLDVKFSPDNQTALVGAYKNIDLVDVRDPTSLIRVGRWNFTDAPEAPAAPLASSQNAHMLSLQRIAGQDWVFMAPQMSNGVWILKLQGGPEARSLKFVTTTQRVHGGVSGPHDIFLQDDPFTHKWILYSADAFMGWAAFDVSDPANPKLITLVPNPEGASGLHSVQAAKIGNRRIVATSTEAPAQSLKIWDATDLQKPLLIAYWNRDRSSASTLDDQHNINFVEGRLYMAHYAHGLFVFDLNKLPMAPGAAALTLQPVAHYAGSEKAPAAGGFAAGGFWDIVVHHGLVYASAYSGGFEEGLHVLAYGCLAPGSVAQSSVG